MQKKYLFNLFFIFYHLKKYFLSYYIIIDELLGRQAVAFAFKVYPDSQVMHPVALKQSEQY